MMRKSWHLAYGSVLAIAVAAGLVMMIVNASSFVPNLGKEFRATFIEFLPIQLGVIALLSALERIAPAAGPRKSIKGYFLNFNLTLLDLFARSILGSAIGAWAVGIAGRLGLGVIDLRFSTGHGVGALVLAALLGVCISDFLYYWFHRFQHESKFLWQEHKLHHMDEELCALYRQSWLEGLFQGPATAIPIAILFKLDPVQGGYVGYVFAAWAVFIHTNVRLHLGPISVLFSSPQVHRIHHSRVREHHDPNYAAYFPIWDIIFGTYHHPRRDEYPLTGVHDEIEVKTLSEAATLPFREWWKMLLASRRVSNPTSQSARSLSRD